MPRRRRGASAIALDTETERGFAMRVLLHSPKDLVAGTLAFAAIIAIVTNALFMQAGRHPSPMFGSVITLPPPGPPASSPLPRPRPMEAAARPADALPPESRSTEPKAVESKPVESRPVESRPAAESRPSDPLTNLVKATTVAPVATSAIPRPPAPIPVAHHELSPGGSRRIAAVQRALTEYGYGQLKPTGIVGSDTQAAVAKFEREHKIPATGQISEHMIRELSAAIGHPID
jgi:hypothetical protein